MQKIINRLAGEPVAVRTLFAAVLTFLVSSGVIDTGAAESVEHVVLALIDVALIASARSAVTPVANAR